MGAQTPFVQLSHPSLLLQLRPGSSQSGCHCPTPSSGDCALLGPLTGLLIPRPSERLAILALPPMPPGRARCPLCTCTEPSSPVGLPTPSPKLLPTGSCDCDCRRLSPLPPLRGLCHLSGASATAQGPLPPLRGLCHLSGASVTSQGPLRPLRGLCDLSGASVTSQEMGCKGPTP